MKIVMLVDGGKENFTKLIKAMDYKKTISLDMESMEECCEYSCLSDAILDFFQSSNDIMVARFSGRETIAQTLGDEHSEMILFLSYNKQNKYYADCPVERFTELMDVFEKESIAV